MVKRPLILIAVVATIGGLARPAEPAGAAAPSFTIETSGGVVSRIGSFRPNRDATIASAVRAFGAPSTTKVLPYQSCLVEWRRLRLRIHFAHYGLVGPGQTTCTRTVGQAQSFVVRGQRFRTWRGLRVLHRSSTIPDLHPAAEFLSGAWWLRTATSPYGDNSEYGVVRAIVSGGLVRALTGWIGAAGD